MVKRKREGPYGRPQELDNPYRSMHLLPRKWVPFFERFIKRGDGKSEADLIRRALMKEYPELPSPYVKGQDGP